MFRIGIRRASDRCSSDVRSELECASRQHVKAITHHDIICCGTVNRFHSNFNQMLQAPEIFQSQADMGADAAPITDAIT
jgi:hypothetical protein